MLQPLRAEEYSHIRGSVQRYSHRRVAARACGTRAASRSCPPRPRPGNADFSLHVPRAVEGGPGPWEGAAISLLREGSEASCLRHGSLVGGVVLPGVRGRRANHQSSVIVISLSFPPATAVSEESRLLCRPEAWEGGNPAHRRGHALVMLCLVALYTDLSQLQAVSR